MLSPAPPCTCVDCQPASSSQRRPAQQRRRPATGSSSRAKRQYGEQRGAWQYLHGLPSRGIMTFGLLPHNPLPAPFTRSIHGRPRPGSHPFPADTNSSPPHMHRGPSTLAPRRPPGRPSPHVRPRPRRAAVRRSANGHIDPKRSAQHISPRARLGEALLAVSNGSPRVGLQWLQHSAALR